MVGIYRLLQLLYRIYVFRLNRSALKVSIIVRHLRLFPTSRGHLNPNIRATLVLILVIVVLVSRSRVWTGVEIEDGGQSRLQIARALLPLGRHMRIILAVVLVIVIGRVTTVDSRIEVQIFTAQAWAIIVFPSATPIRISYPTDRQTDRHS